MAEQGEEEFQFQHSWAPATPLRPTLPTPPQIYAEKQVNAINQANWLGSEGCLPGFTGEAQANGLPACIDPADCTAVNEGVNHLQTALARRTGISIGNMTCTQFPIDPTAEFSNVPFGDLLDLANAAARARSRLRAAPQRNDSMTTDSSISTMDSKSDSNQVEPSSAGPWLADDDFSNIQIDPNCTPRKPQNESIPQQSYDLNLLPGTMAKVASHKTISEFAPITPDKAMRVGREEALIESLQADDRTSKERDKQGNKLTATAVDSNSLQFSRDLHEPVTDSSLVSAPTEENQNPDKGGNQTKEISGTPQQKPRRKKHRPKVITEGKPRTPKPRTPKSNGSQENPTGKRKYVRRKGVDKGSSTPTAEASGESMTHKRKYVRKKVLNKDSSAPTTKESGGASPEALVAKKKSCRRALNFDMEGLQEVEISTSKSVCSNSELDAQNLWRTGSQAKSALQPGEGTEVTPENTEASIANVRPCSKNQIPKHSTSLSEGQAPSTPLPANNKPQRGKRKANSQRENYVEGKDKGTARDRPRHDAQIMSQTDTGLSSRSRNNFNCRTSSTLEEEQARRGLKRNNSNSTEPNTSNTNVYGSHYNSLCTYQAMSCMHFPNIHKRKRTDKGQTSTTSDVPSLIAAEIFVPQGACSVDTASGGLTTLREAVRENPQNIQQTFGCIIAFNQNKRLKKKRSKASTRVQDFTLLSSIVECTNQPTCSREAAGDSDRKGVGGRPHTSIEALVAEMQSTLARKKRTKKRNSITNPASSGMSEVQTAQKIVLYGHKQLFSGAPPEVLWKEMSINAISEQFKHLSINREGSHDAYQQQNAIIPYDMRNQEQNALVLYTRDGTVVPYPMKKRHPRPKVELDEETNRVWKLLLENINSEGIDGTDEEKAKWWEEERRVFRGRAESFIARMHLVQGDRRFSQWKGSVVDSVIGVFLTQNVSDHLSSSAFMSLAAHFPLKSKDNEQPYHEGDSSLIIDRPEFYVLDPEETLQWNEKPIHPVHDQSSVTLNDSWQLEEKEAVNSNDLSGSSTGITSSINESMHEMLSYSPRDSETCHDSVASRSDMQIIGGGDECSQYDEATNGAISYQNSMVPSHSSQNSSIAQTAERTGSSSESYSEAVDQIKEAKFNMLNNSSCSFVKLLEMAGSTMLHEVYVHANYSMSFLENLKAQGSQCQNNHRQGMDNLGVPKSFMAESIIPSANFHPHLTINSEVMSVEHSEMFKEETKSSKMSKKKNKNSMKEQSPLANESANKITDQNGTVPSVQVVIQSPGEYNQLSNNSHRDKSAITLSQAGLQGECGNLVESSAQVQNKEMQRHLKNHSGDILDVTESTTTFDNPRNTQQKIQESKLYEHSCSFNKEHNEMEAATSKPKGRKAAKEKESHDWDSLRKQAEAGGKKRERTEKTMDSLDYEAVRCADVHEIAETIKERGMNNMLAERIKDFLNRLVREHGSIDLEWLRDVPPDKAKEYLLSIRGLGLKSVECVRLLTLHHLAFPVDTNVGRIAVRLGWVPLQPLPESLQLHLLELYPVLESIQKYLWPRLCKLDQRTLYELHYQMITFGKVFCTKSKPNCNACPMRGECRHFASAFASVRLALPGPEEKSIISAMENTAYDQNSATTIDQPLLPLPQPIEQPEGNPQFEANRQTEGKDGANKCEPIIEEPASPEPVCTQVSENDIEDIEDTLCDDPDEIPTIKLDMEEFTQTLQNYMQNNMELQEGDMSKALVALTAEAASIPTPKLKNVSRLRTEHHVYELPDSHPLLKGMEEREPDDPCKYLLAIWTPGETANSIQPPERRCSSQEHGKLCDDQTCFSCNSIREAESHIVRGTLLIPCRTAMRGSFPLNGTYFQVNEVFADHSSSLNPIDVPREWLWNLPRRTVYFGTSIPSIFKGLTTEGIQHCFWRGYVCVRGFDQKTRAPRPLIARLHFPASKLNKAKGKAAADDD
ncbi:hypothetical protein SLEP1_g45586 [Rubroshorea leprosula]|uniref:HhH-GPD domain-containing protein n=1 Tax=Rubroshorea leprosula TaxID=152421 RepID=A0AAV5LLS5_9ROSI|nr:hypothetical protein SLEP1_g45586 [Rubroshorea leprosula]